MIFGIILVGSAMFISVLATLVDDWYLASAMHRSAILTAFAGLTVCVIAAL